MNKTNSSIPAPQSNGFPGGAGSPQQAAMAAGLQKANLLNDLNKAGSGGKRGNRGGAIPISIPTPMYANANGGQGVTNQTMQNAGNVNQLAVNNELYSKVKLVPVPQTGGCDWKGGNKNKRKKKAGTRIMGPNTTWGCYSGGKRRTNQKRTKRRSTKRTIKRRTTKRRYG